MFNKIKLLSQPNTLKKGLLGQRLLLVILILLATCLISLPIKAQVFTLPDLTDTNNWLLRNDPSSIVSNCIRLDGLCLFKVVAPKSDISERVTVIEERLNQIIDLYLSKESPKIKIEQTIINNLPNIYITINEQKIRLMTVTSLDVNNEGIDPSTKASFIIEQLERGLQRAKQEREFIFLLSKGLISLGILGGIVIINFVLGYQINRFKHSQNKTRDLRNNQPISTVLIERQQWNIKEVKYRVLQLVQTAIWLGGIVLIVGLFPQTRIIRIWLFNILRIPAKLAIVGAGTYLLIRLSYALIAKLSAIIFSQDLLNLDINQRLQLRLTTLSLVSRSIITVIWVGVGTLVGLSVIGVNTAPLLTGLGILGVGVSLASQNLIRDGINGFFIIIEDQYAVGDMIEVGNFSGLVENINLRITQLRDSQGRLITIPNSEVKIVANLSSNWSRADLSIPIAYETDVDLALKIIKDVADKMRQDKILQQNILENPEILGVENFEERGLIIRVWIKTKPLKQWDVSREFRRRLKVEFDLQGLPLPQLKVWLNRI
ncbi:mechanosensitive ion channel family protein [Aphanothece sacrum]|uniref:Mechanosensitive ion channel protein n=1 Tax=Aphanothece sacrum FPU1 TaxID=1920663 RepID=A0A401IG62_APHSA|nr:mechanosensitive ion channel family protein [Aphanothece sacrum]GBF80199.1 mechanosensitive ion channel protein [Aphanothece sacrum FPU1]GBF85352.1 mechanosensitive ion channel protein [Aphanothece sacrum FPU3]